MIGRLRGILLEKQPPQLVIDVQGVGYEVEAPMSTFYKLPDTGAEISLYTHLIVRDDAHLLYGFGSNAERRLFRSLLKVNGVGPKLALAILSGIETDAFVDSINSGNTARLVRLPGVGKKTADRLIIEMRDRLHEWHHEPRSVTGGDGRPLLLNTAANALDDAISALIALGYKPPEAERLVRSIATADMSREDLIRKALQAV
jgi:holliday junction DNA helicase RuvA